MALKVNVLNLNIPILFFNKDIDIDENPNIYIKIERYSGENKTCRFVLRFYHIIINEYGDGNANIESKFILNFPENVYQFEVNESEDDKDFNVRKQGYEYLKTLPEFEGCEDC